MGIKDFLAPSQVLVDVRASNTTRLLQELARRAAAGVVLDANAVAGALLKREELGSTGTGGGVAIPHARLPGVSKPFGLLARLAKAIDFDSIDGQPVDVVCLLLLPAGAQAEHLNALASVARKLRDAETLRKLRRAPNEDALYRAMAEN
jgi:PTS system nitrogen regulatory IIA component